MIFKHKNISSKRAVASVTSPSPEILRDRETLLRPINGKKSYSPLTSIDAWQPKVALKSWAYFSFKKLNEAKDGGTYL